MFTVDVEQQHNNNNNLFVKAGRNISDRVNTQNEAIIDPNKGTPTPLDIFVQDRVICILHTLTIFKESF